MICVGGYAHCRRCGGVANEKACLHGTEHRLDSSVILLRRMLTDGKAPEGLTRPEVAQIILSVEQPCVE